MSFLIDMTKKTESILTACDFLEINGRKIGPGFPVYIVAEMSANHKQRFEDAVKIIEAAKKAGADAIKIQTYKPETITLRSDKEYFRIRGGTLWDGRTLYDLYEEAHTPWDWQPKLKKIADNLGIDFFSSAFDSTAVDFLETFNVPAYKVASFELVDIPLIEKMAKTGKPLILSTGMAELSEIEEALDAAFKAGATQVAILKCTSEYPAKPEDSHLRAIPFFRERFKVPVGFSDHTLGALAAVSAVSLGACIVEKHLRLGSVDKTPDSEFSLSEKEFAEMVQAIRYAEKVLGQSQYRLGKQEENSRLYRRSLFIAENIKSGEAFTDRNVRSVRPGQGLPPKHLPQILGRKAKQNLEKGTPLAWEHVSDV